MSIAALVATSRQTEASTIAIATALAILISSGILGYSFFKQARGDWKHIDASQVQERAQFNNSVGPALLAISAIISLTSAHIGIAVVIALSGLIVMSGHLLQGYSKPSLHVAFAVFAALIVWPQLEASLAFSALALGIAWSRSKLKRHVNIDLVHGAGLGLSAGIAFQLATSYIGH